MISMADFSLDLPVKKFDLEVDDKVLEYTNAKAIATKEARTFYSKAQDTLFEYQSMDYFLANYEDDANKAIDNFIGRLVELLADHDIYDIDVQTFHRKVDTSYFDVKPNPIRECYENVSEHIGKIDEQVADAKDTLEIQKESRGRVIGGGFGLTGAAKGMLTAGAINSVTGYFYGRSNAKKSKELDDLALKYKSGLLGDAIKKGLDAIGVYLQYCVADYLYYIGLPRYEFEDTIKKSNAIINNIISGSIKGEKRTDAAIKAISLNPSNVYAYVYLTLIYGRNKSIDNIVKKLALEDDFEKSLLEGIKLNLRIKKIGNQDFDGARNELHRVEQQLEKYGYTIGDYLTTSDSQDIKDLMSKITLEGITFDNAEEYKEAFEAEKIFNHHTEGLHEDLIFNFDEEIKSRYEDICYLSKEALSKTGNVLLVYYSVLKKLIIDENKSHPGVFNREPRPVYYEAMRKIHRFLLDRMASNEELQDEESKKQLYMLNLLYKYELSIDEVHNDNLTNLIMATQEYKKKYGYENLYIIYIQRLLEDYIDAFKINTDKKLEIMTNHVFFALCQYFESKGADPCKKEFYTGIKKFVMENIPSIDLKHKSGFCLRENGPFLSNLRAKLGDYCDSFGKKAENEPQKMRNALANLKECEEYEFLYAWKNFDSDDFENVPLEFKSKKSISVLRYLAKEYLVFDKKEWDEVLGIESRYWTFDPKEFDAKGFKKVFDGCVKLKLLPPDMDYDKFKSKTIAFANQFVKLLSLSLKANEEAAIVIMDDALLVTTGSNLLGRNSNGYFPYSQFTYDNFKSIEPDGGRKGCYDVKFISNNKEKYELSVFDHNIFAVLHLAKSNFELKESEEVIKQREIAEAEARKKAEAEAKEKAIAEAEARKLAEEADKRAIAEENARKKAKEEANQRAITEEEAGDNAKEEANQNAIGEENIRRNTEEEAKQRALAEARGRAEMARQNELKNAKLAREREARITTFKEKYDSSIGGFEANKEAGWLQIPLKLLSGGIVIPFIVTFIFVSAIQSAAAVLPLFILPLVYLYRVFRRYGKYKEMLAFYKENYPGQGWDKASALAMSMTWI